MSKKIKLIDLPEMTGSLCIEYESPLSLFMINLIKSKENDIIIESQGDKYILEVPYMNLIHKVIIRYRDDKYIDINDLSRDVTEVRSSIIHKFVDASYKSDTEECLIPNFIPVEEKYLIWQDRNIVIPVEMLGGFNNILEYDYNIGYNNMVNRHKGDTVLVYDDNKTLNKYTFVGELDAFIVEDSSGKLHKFYGIFTKEKWLDIYVRIMEGMINEIKYH